MPRVVISAKVGLLYLLFLNNYLFPACFLEQEITWNRFLKMCDSTLTTVTQLCIALLTNGKCLMKGCVCIYLLWLNNLMKFKFTNFSSAPFKNRLCQQKFVKF